MTWLKVLGAAVVILILAVIFLVVRRSRRAGGVLAIPSQIRSTGEPLDSSPSAAPILNPNGDIPQRKD
jgi:hypothetical protein